MTINDPVVAYLDPTVGMLKIICPKCLLARDGSATANKAVRVYESNIKPYTQDCHECGRIVFKGPADTILFDNPNKQTL